MKMSTSLQLPRLVTGRVMPATAVPHAARVVMQWGVLYAMYLLGTEVVAATGLRVPGTVVGMLLLFLGLQTGLIPATWIQDGAGILLKHLAFFFIPISVGLLAWGGLVRAAGWQLFGALVVSAAVGIVVTGHVAAWLVRRKAR